MNSFPSPEENHQDNTVVEENLIDNTIIDAKKNQAALKIGARSVILAVSIIVALMVVSFVLTKIIPQGEYLRHFETIDGEQVEKYTLDENGEPIFVIGEAGKGMKLWRFILSPVLVLIPNSTSNPLSVVSPIYLILLLLLAVGGVFNVLDKTGALQYMLSKIAYRFKEKKLALLAVTSLIFMVLGSTIGIMEESIPFVPIMILLCYSIGLDSMCALAITLLSASFGFAAGVINPYTTMNALLVGGITDITYGIGVRLIVFALTYGILLLVLLPYAKKILAHPEKSIVFEEDSKARKELQQELEIRFNQNPKLDKAGKWFKYNFIFLAVFIGLSMFISALSSIAIIVIVAVFVSCCIGSAIIVGTPAKEILRQYGKGALAVAPALLLILMAMSVRFIISDGGIMDTLLFYATKAIKGVPEICQPLILYLVVFVMNFFITSGSAKAGLMMPILYPISDFAGINRVVTVTAFLFGDGFSNMLFPTNAALLIALSLSPVSFSKWFKWTMKAQILLLIMSSAILLILDAFYSMA